MGRGIVSIQTPRENGRMIYHIYFKGECLFKDLSEGEFQIIWGRIYRSYFTEDISYSAFEVEEGVEEHSY